MPSRKGGCTRDADEEKKEKKNQREERKSVFETTVSTSKTRGNHADHLRNAMDATYRRLIPFRVQRALYTRATRGVFETRGYARTNTCTRTPSATCGFTSERANERGRSATPCSGERGGCTSCGTKSHKWECQCRVFSWDPEIPRCVEDVILVKSGLAILSRR